MTILSRHAGIDATTTDKILAHLADALIPRVKPFLDRLKTEERRREQERFMRAEQDRAYREAMNRDKERIERKIREELEAQRRAEEERATEEKRLKAEGEDRKRREEWGRKRMEWRRYLRWLSKANPAPSTGLRIGVRMPDGTRGIRIFSPRDSLTALYGFVDTHFIPSELLVGEDPTSPPSSSRGEAAVREEIIRSSLTPEQWWKFRLATSYPRREIPWQPNATLGGISGLETGVQLVVEIVRDDDSKRSRRSQDSRSSLAASTNASDDGDDSAGEYDTESDDE
jgi:FAS-associated factor 2